MNNGDGGLMNTVKIVMFEYLKMWKNKKIGW